MRWLFLATLPNSGSTAFTRFLETAPHLTSAQANGEAQWLVPQMSDNRRWDPHLELDYRMVRAVWMRNAHRRSGGSGVILEKSPPNVVRMGALIEAFADADPIVMLFTRDPLAICASWAARKNPATLMNAWLPRSHPPLLTDADFHRALGEVCGLRFTMLDKVREFAATVVSYEELTDYPERVAAAVSQLVPEIGVLDTGVSVSVKDYEAQRLRNMNHEQVARLTNQQRSWIHQGLSPYRDVFTRFGYHV